MINLKTDNHLLLAEREKAKKHLLDEVLKESPLNSECIDDLINMTEVAFASCNLEINEKNISLVYSRIYSPALKDALPEHLLKGRSEIILKKL